MKRRFPGSCALVPEVGPSEGSPSHPWSGLWVSGTQAHRCLLSGVSGGRLTRLVPVVLGVCEGYPGPTRGTVVVQDILCRSRSLPAKGHLHGDFVFLLYVTAIARHPRRRCRCLPGVVVGAVSGAVVGTVAGAVVGAVVARVVVTGAVSGAVVGTVAGTVSGAVSEAVVGTVAETVSGAVAGAVAGVVSGVVVGTVSPLSP